MDYKQKYKEALEKAKIWQEHLNETGDKDFADELIYIFPELKESEGEKVRKELLAVVNDLVLPDEQQSRFISWLEKQDEQKPIDWDKQIKYNPNAPSIIDENTLSNAIFFIREYQTLTRDKTMLNAAKEAEDWLKSIKQRIGG